MNQKLTNLRPSNLERTNITSSVPIRMPGQLLCPAGFRFDALERQVQRHLFKNYLPSLMENADRYLAIVGEPGTSKTVTSCDAALRFGFAVAHLPAASLASENEGGATAILSEFFVGVCASSLSHQIRHAVVIDDLELSIIGTDDKTGKTINTALLTGEFQRIADKPKPYRNYDGSVIPVIFTGNDFSKIRSSLLRDARTTEYVHRPSPEERLAFAFHQLGPTTPGELRLVEKLARKYRHQPIAFWSALASDLRLSQLDRLISHGVRDPVRAERILAHDPVLDDAVLWSLARARASKTNRSFL